MPSGPLATGLCVVAVALVGFAALGGRLPVRLGARVVLGCCVVLGAPVIALALMGQGEGRPSSNLAIPEEETLPPERADLPPANPDPYSWASLRRD